MPKEKWYLNSGGSIHMIGNKILFKSIVDYNGGDISFDNNTKGNLIGIFTISFNELYDITIIYLVKSLMYNLLSIR